jgi:hypothetical protein
MAQYFTDFSEYTVGSAPPDFSLVWGGPIALSIESGNPLAGSDRSLRLAPSDSSYERSAIEWTAGTTSGKTTLTVLIGYDDGVGFTIAGPFLSGSGTSGTRTGYVVWFGSEIRLARYDSGSDSAIAVITNPLSTSGAQNYYVEILRDASLIEIRTWDILGSRPASANVAYTDSSSLPVSGFFGISHLSTSDKWLRVRSIAVGTDGDAPPEAPPLGPNTPINPSITNLLATSARLNWEQG